MSQKSADFPRAEDHNDLAPLSGDGDHAASRQNLKRLQKHESAQALNQDQWSEGKTTVGGVHTAQALHDHLENYRHNAVIVHDGSQGEKTVKHPTSRVSDELGKNGSAF